MNWKYRKSGGWLDKISKWNVKWREKTFTRHIPFWANSPEDNRVVRQALADHLQIPYDQLLGSLEITVLIRRYNYDRYFPNGRLYMRKDRTNKVDRRA